MTVYTVTVFKAGTVYTVTVFKAGAQLNIESTFCRCKAPLIYRLPAMKSCELFP